MINTIYLEDLFVGENNLLYLPRTIGKLKNLKTLNMAQNQLTSIPDTIGNLTSLEHLILWVRFFKNLLKGMYVVEKEYWDRDWDDFDRLYHRYHSISMTNLLKQRITDILKLNDIILFRVLIKLNWLNQFNEVEFQGLLRGIIWDVFIIIKENWIRQLNATKKP